MEKSTRDELLALGINPDCPMASPRLPDRPARVRYGDDLITRRQDGGIQHAFAYFSAPQVWARRLWAEKIEQGIKDAGLRARL